MQMHSKQQQHRSGSTSRPPMTATMMIQIARVFWLEAGAGTAEAGAWPLLQSPAVACKRGGGGGAGEWEGTIHWMIEGTLWLR